MDELFDNLSALRKAGKRIIGCFPLYPPVELLHSFGLTPVTLWGMRPPAGGFRESDRHLQNFTCGVARCMVECILGDAAELLDALFMYNACDTLRNLPEIIGQGLGEQGREKPVFRMHIPAIAPDSGGARSYLDRRVAGLVNDLEQYTGRAFSGQDFVESAGLYRRQRELSLELEIYAREGRIPFSACSDILLGAHHARVEDHIRLLEESISAVEGREPADKSAIPVMISGIHIPDRSIIETMEAAGFRIVANDVATLGRSYGYSPEITDNPVKYYRDFYFNHYPCTTMLPDGDRRVDRINRTVRDLGIQAVIFLGEKFCEYEYFEMPYMNNTLKDAGIRTLFLEFGVEDRDDSSTIHNRIMAFAEMLAIQQGA